MKILVIGSQGFIGSHLVDALVAAGHETLGLDNDSQSAQLPHDTKAGCLVLGDARDISRYYSPRDGWDYIFHCASPAGPARIAPGYALKPIMETTWAGLEFARIAKAKFIKLSTSEVYGHSGVLEEDTPLQVVQPYDARSEYQIGFIAAEQMCMSHSTEVQVLRLFNVVGPRQQARAGVVLPRFCEHALKGEPIIVYGDGHQRRAFLDISDLIRFLLIFLEKWPARGIWNVANPDNLTSMSLLAEQVKAIAESKSPIRYKPAPWRDAPEKAVVHIARAKSLGWRPTKNLDHIIRTTLAWHQEQLAVKGNGRKHRRSRELSKVH